MIDKQIIIDGVDVSGWTDEEVKYKFAKHSPKAIRQIAFDLYKQLKHKEQECEELKGKLKYIRDENVHLKESATDEQMDFLALNNYISTLEFQIDQLKAENEKLDKEVKLLRQYKCSKQASYESMQVERNKAVSRNQDLLKQVEKWQEKCNKLEAENEKLKHDNGYEVGALEKTIDNLKAENEDLKKQLMQKSEIDMFFNTPLEGWSSNPCDICQYKQTLTEIKEIADKDFRHTAWEEYAKQLKQILQKIRECEVENEN